MSGFRKWWQDNVVGEEPEDMGRTSVLDQLDAPQMVTDDELAVLTATLDPAGVGRWAA